MKKKLTKEYQIFEGRNLQEGMDKLLKAGYFPVTDLKEAYDWQQRVSPNKWVDVGVVYQKGELRPITKVECKDLKKLYDEKGRLLFLGYSYNGDLGGFDNLYYYARFLGAKRR